MSTTPGSAQTLHTELAPLAKAPVFFDEVLKAAGNNDAVTPWIESFTQQLRQPTSTLSRLYRRHQNNPAICTAIVNLAVDYAEFRLHAEKDITRQHLLQREAELGHAAGKPGHAGELLFNSVYEIVDQEITKLLSKRH